MLRRIMNCLPPWLCALLLVLSPITGEGARAASGGPSVPAVGTRDTPQIARATRVFGTVLVEALVDETGHVRATNIVRSQPVLDDEAAARVAALAFPPLIEAGKAVPAVRTIPVTFNAPGANGAADANSRLRCDEVTFGLELDARPDSAGRFTAHWTARGLKSQELFVIVLYPDGAQVDTAGSWFPQEFRGVPDSDGWPAWHREPREVKAGTEGSFSFRLPDAPWWSEGRVAVVALFRDTFDGRSVLKQLAFRVEHDAMGALLVGDPRVTACAAGPLMEGR
jgi:TonB family protein